MTGKLRVRFVLVAVAALIVMQGLIIFFSAQRSVHNMIDKADSLIAAIHDAYPADAGVDARYFVAALGSGEKNSKLDMTNIRFIKKDRAREYIKRALDTQEDAGFVDTFRYRIYRDEQGIHLVFLERNHNIDAIRNTVASSALFSGIGLSVMLVLLVAISFWVTQPVKVCYDKQQQFVTSASHELGTPLTVIKADADILQLDDPDNEWLCDIQKQIEQLTEMTHRLTTLAKMDEQKNKIKRIVFPLSDLAEDAAMSYRALAQAEEKHFSVIIEPDLVYNGEENMIRQLMTILLDNAFKYCPSCGVVDLSVKKVSQGIQISVCNNTQGLGTDDLSRIFDRFYRAKQVTDSGKKGYGLGLSIAEAIIKAHKSKISAKVCDQDRLQIVAVLK